MKSKTLIQCLLACLAISGATGLTLNSQETNLLPKPDPGRPAPPQEGQGFFMAGLGPLGNALTDAQRASFRQAMQAQREKVRDLEAQLREARGKLLVLGLDGKFDEAVVRKQATSVAVLEAEMSVVRARALSQVQPPLAPEQIEKIKNGFAIAPQRNGFRAEDRMQPRIERRQSLTTTNRDANDLPSKQ